MAKPSPRVLRGECQGQQYERRAADDAFGRRPYGQTFCGLFEESEELYEEKRDEPKEDACNNHLRQEEPAEDGHELEGAVEIGNAEGSRHLVADDPRDKRGEEHVVT